MPPTVRNQEWRASHENNKYPFEDRAKLINNDGDMLFEGLFLDAVFYPVGGQASGYLSKVTVTSDTVTLTVGDSGSPSRAYASFDRFYPPEELRFVDFFDRPAGVVVSEPTRLAILNSMALGDHTFQPGEAGFVARVWTPVVEAGVSGVELDDGSVLTGDVWLVGDDGIVLSCSVVSVKDSCDTFSEATVIRVDVVGDPLYRRRLCADTEFFATPKFVESIVFCKPASGDLPQACFECSPDETGEIQVQVGNTLATDTILRIRPASDGMIVEAVGEKLESIR